MTKIILVCLFFIFNETPVDLSEGSVIKIETYVVEKEMESMEECRAAKHQLEIIPPPPPAFAAGFYCEERKETDI